jgi:magnesium chelatase subunit D
VSPPLTSQERLIRALACAAITPGLRSILVFDAPPLWLEAIAGLLGRMLEAAFGQAPVRGELGTTEDEDALWGRYGFSGSQQEQSLVWWPGPFEPAPDERTPRLVVIPDLSRLGLAATRAAVSLVGADTAQVERHGQSRTWRPELCWVAACPRERLGRLSPHLLDRFALRLDGSRLEPVDPLEALQRALRKEPVLFDTSGGGAKRYMHWVPLRKGLERRPTVSDEALRRVVEYFSQGEAPPPGVRRPLALARLTDALARIEGREYVTPAQVDAAADLVGLVSPDRPGPRAEQRQEPPRPEPEARRPAAVPVTLEPGVLTESKRLDGTPVAPVKDDTIHPPKEPEVVPAGSLAPGLNEAPQEPYPEDTAPVEREPASLCPPPQRRTSGRAAQRGTIVGVVPARDLSDLALTGTLLEAAKYQAIRRKNRPEAEGILLSASDLRGYRRAVPPERLLVLVIDFTSLTGWDWGAAVLPFLKAAYTERAAVCVVQVGAADSEHELSARRVQGRNVLAASVNQALASERGKATPLAHGLQLALETLRHALRHGRSTALEAQLVVVTDGRGNVPLEASRQRAITAPVSDQGVKDALAVAEQLRALERVESVLIHPSPRFYPELPSTLAAALGAGMRALRKETG